MINKLFGSKADSLPEKIPDCAYLERLLAEVALDIPQIEWIALVKSNGVFIGSFPSKPGVETDRISAMSAAMSSLGERIASELNNGNMQYTLIGGTNGISVMIELSPKYLLAIGLKKNVSIEESLCRLQETSIPLLMKTLKVEGILQLSGVQQK
jgi:predicted regulator of Ras-like GTPase activity (Roadblock/LC7/MglB family)